MVVANPSTMVAVAPEMSHEEGDPRLGPISMRFEDVSVTFHGRTAIRDVSFDVPKNKVTSLIGPSGSGKTTLLRAVNRLHDETKGAVVTGSIRLGDVDIYNGGIPATLLRTRGRHGVPTPEPVSHDVDLRQCRLRVAVQWDTQKVRP